MKILFEECKVVAEASAAAPVAALLAEKIPLPNPCKRVVCVLGGANVSIDDLYQQASL